MLTLFSQQTTTAHKAIPCVFPATVGTQKLQFLVHGSHHIILMTILAVRKSLGTVFFNTFYLELHIKIPSNWLCRSHFNTVPLWLLQVGVAVIQPELPRSAVASAYSQRTLAATHTCS